MILSSRWFLKCFVTSLQILYGSNPGEQTRSMPSRPPGLQKNSLGFTPELSPITPEAW